MLTKMRAYERFTNGLSMGLFDGVEYNVPISPVSAAARLVPPGNVTPNEMVEMHEAILRDEEVPRPSRPLWDKFLSAMEYFQRPGVAEFRQFTKHPGGKMPPSDALLEGLLGLRPLLVCQRVFPGVPDEYKELISAEISLAIFEVLMPVAVPKYQEAYRECMTYIVENIHASPKLSRYVKF